MIDFAIPYGNESLETAFKNWRRKAKNKACVDYCFHMAITKWDKHGPEMEKMVKMGCPTFKEFMIYESEGWQSDDRAIFGALENCKKLGAMLLIHAESSRVLDELIARHHTPKLMKQYGACLHAITRPHYIEAEAIQRAVKFLTGLRPGKRRCCGCRTATSSPERSRGPWFESPRTAARPGSRWRSAPRSKAVSSRTRPPTPE